MAMLTIRNLDERTLAQLRVQAARHGRSMEEALTILRFAIEAQQYASAGNGLGCRIHAHFAPLGGVDLELPERCSLSTSAWS